MYNIVYNTRNNSFKHIPLLLGKRSKFSLDISSLNIYEMVIKPAGCVLQILTPTSYYKPFYIDCSIKERNRLKF